MSYAILVTMCRQYCAKQEKDKTEGVKTTGADVVFPQTRTKSVQI